MKGLWLLTVMLLLCRSSLAAPPTKPLVPLRTGATLTQPPNPHHFYFVVSGDNRAAGRGVPMPPTANRIFKEISRIHPAFTLWTGDTIYGFTDTPGEAAREYQHFLAAARTAGTPIYNAPGNHEIYNRPGLQSVYEQQMGSLYGSFNYGTCHFIALDTEEVAANGGFSSQQLNWLRTDLASNSGAQHIFVFMHHPLYPLFPEDALKNPVMRKALQSLFAQYHVAYVFSGHEHIYYASVHQGVHYVVTGGAGAPMDAAPEKGGFLHYLLVNVNGSTVHQSVLQPWRLSVTMGPKEANEWQSALVCNYNASPVPVLVEFDEGELTPNSALVQATWKGKKISSNIPARMVTGVVPGRIGALVTVPPGIAVVVSLRPKAMPMANH